VKRNWLAALAILLTAGAWGATFVIIKNVLAQIAPEPFIFYRFTIAGLFLLALAIPRRSVSRAVLRPAIALGILVFAGYWMQTRALMVISASRSAFLTGLYVVMVPFCDRVTYGTRVSLKAWSGSVLAAIGASVLIGGFDTRPSWGDLLTLGCAVCFAFHVVLSARYTLEHSATGLAAIQVLFVGVAAGVPSLFAPRPPATTQVVVVVLFTAIVTTALAFAALMWGQARVSATEAAVILSFEPVAASLTAILWQHEPVTLSFAIGALVILAAMIVSQLPDRPSATMRVDAANPGHE
jgi:drug/metabolite transporter (DMT)-like permease